MRTAILLSDHPYAKHNTEKKRYSRAMCPLSEDWFCMTDENPPKNHRVILKWIYNPLTFLTIQMRF